MSLRPRFLLLPCVLGSSLLLASCADSGQAMEGALKDIGTVLGAGLPMAGPAQNDIAAALKEALNQGAGKAVNLLGRSDGYWADPAVRIPLPDFIGKYANAARTLGMGSTLDQFQLTLNRAAEQAVPQVTGIFANAITRMTLADAQQILRGPDNAATEFFRRTSTNELYLRIHPIVAEATAQVGVTQQYKKLASKAGPILRLSGSEPPADLDDYVTQRALEGLFVKIADEEARIRRDPAARTTELLRKVFAAP